MSIKVQNAPDSAVVGWHGTPDGGQGYWNGYAWTVRLAAPATVLPAPSHARRTPGRGRPRLPWTLAGGRS